jgi:hypothetical protein
MTSGPQELARALGVRFTTAVRAPVTDPTLGVDVAHPDRPRRHRLVTVGDSLTQGFAHYAVHESTLSWPALVARQLGIPFTHPVDHGPGGYPLNLEFLARRAAGRPLLPGLVAGLRYALQVQRAYEVPLGAPGGPRSENLAVWGWDLRDHLERTADTERARVGRPGWSPLVDDANARSGVEVLDGSRAPDGTALTTPAAAAEFAREGLETLAVWLGANNALRSVVDLAVRPSGEGFRDLRAKEEFTVWSVPHFRAELAELAARVRAVGADRVVWGTVPHVTIPPVSHGLGGSLPQCPRYFRWYARPWKTADSFDPERDRHLTGVECWAVDLAIDGYNTAITEVVEQARRDGLNWLLVDGGAVLDRLAVRRNDELGARPAEFPPYPLPAPLTGLDTRFPRTSDTGELLAGGLIGLDGVHPTTCGYAVVAQEVARALAADGVAFPHGPEFDFAQLRALDTFVADPPAGIDRVLRRVDRVDRLLRPFRSRGRSES